MTEAEQIMKRCQAGTRTYEEANNLHAACYGIIGKLLAQPEQEPVAWRTFDGEGGYDYRSYEDNESYADDWNKRNPNHAGWVDKLYTLPQRTWVGLEGEEIRNLWEEATKPDRSTMTMVTSFARAIDAKLKDKNS